MTLRAIFFDVDDTLYSTTEFAERARYAAVDSMIEHGLKMPREEVYRELMEVVREFSSNNDRHYRCCCSGRGAAMRR
jgi:putative hydrolase of the HAD superfamily